VQAKLLGLGDNFVLHSMHWLFSRLVLNTQDSSPVAMQLTKCVLVWHIWMKFSQVVTLLPLLIRQTVWNRPLVGLCLSHIFLRDLSTSPGY
jgi:hypothetical protein